MRENNLDRDKLVRIRPVTVAKLEKAKEKINAKLDIGKKTDGPD